VTAAVILKAGTASRKTNISRWQVADNRLCTQREFEPTLKEELQKLF
jgi:hypothetical protein